MGKTNGKPEPKLDGEHELPAGENEPDVVEEAVGQAAEPARDDELRRLKREREELYDRLARMQAEFDNARKRAAKEQADFREYAAADAIKPLLPILDSLERALAHAPAGDEFRAGVELIYKQMLDALGKLGLRAIPSVGEPFDPHLHQAVQMVDTTQAPDHQVLEELQRGYKLKDRLLRPAMVRVAHNPKK
ncbi:MAG TPA: nucleotide exchange factor GrpE [Terriglobales bacterium]|jgi:molecular chaperone GrpE|nr:nucleotide exchange factor GrpE [Terriglobales bacterium]